MHRNIFDNSRWGWSYISAIAMMWQFVGCSPRGNHPVSLGHQTRVQESVEVISDPVGYFLDVYYQLRADDLPVALLTEADALAAEAELLYLLGEPDLAESLILEAITLAGFPRAAVAGDSSSTAEGLQHR